MFKLAVNRLDQRGKQGRARDDVGKPLGPNFAKWALNVIRKRVGKSCASGPSVGEGPNNKASKKGRVAAAQNDKNALNATQGDWIGEIFMQPPRGPSKKEIGERLRFVRVGAQS